jgi:hypothetical protein
VLNTTAVALAMLVIASGCPAPPKQHVWKPRTGAIVPSADREHPTSTFTLRDADVRLRAGHLLADVPGAGTWWFAVDVPPVPDRSSDIAFYVEVAPDVEASAIELVDAASGDAIAGALNLGTWKAVVAKQAASRQFLLRVTTPHAMHFEVAAEQRWLNPSTDPVAEPPVELPRCDANAPDFTNPRCCVMTHCVIGQRTCKGKVLSLDPRAPAVTIDIGGDHELMRDALVVVRDRGKNVANGIVLSVDYDHAYVHISDGLDHVAVGATVVITHPDACEGR